MEWLFMAWLKMSATIEIHRTVSTPIAWLGYMYAARMHETCIRVTYIESSFLTHPTNNKTRSQHHISSITAISLSCIFTYSPVNLFTIFHD